MDTRNCFDRRLSGFGEFLQEGYMENLGIANSRRISKVYNNFRYAKRRHEREYRRLEELLEENRKQSGESSERPKVRIEDGFAIDRSGTLPHLDRLIEDSGEIIGRIPERGHSNVQRPYFRNLLFPCDAREYRSIMDFATSSAMLEIVVDYMGQIPMMSLTRPPGFRMMESNKNPNSGNSSLCRSNSPGLGLRRIRILRYA